MDKRETRLPDAAQTSRPRVIPFAWLIVWTTVAAPALASEVDLRLTLVGQGYQTRTADGELLDRRRLTQWVDLRAHGLLGQEGLSFESMFRFDAELGFGDDLEAMGGKQAELMLARVRWQKLGGHTDLVAGRQLLIDELDFLLFDGLRADFRMPASLTIRLVAGFAVRDRSFMGGNVLELDGVEQGSVPAPLAGASLLWRWRDLWVGVDYRRVVLWEEDWPLDEERIGASLSARFWERRLGVEGGAVFDLGEDHWDRLRAEGWFRLPWFGEGFVLQSGYLRSRPRFALDSIFHFFSPAPFDEIRGGLRWTPSFLSSRDGLSVRLAYTHRRYQEPEEGRAGDGAGWKVHGFDLGGGFRIASAGWIGLDTGYEFGASGTRWLVAPRVTWTWLERSLMMEGRGILTSFEDPVQDQQHALTLGCSGTFTWRFSRDHAVILVAQLNGNRIHPVRLRLMAVLDLAFHFGPGGIF